MSLSELQAAVRDNLEASGSLTEARALLRGQVFRTVRPVATGTPAPPADALLIHDLIREYLSYTGLLHTLETFNVETGFADSGASSGATGLPAAFLAEELGLGRQQLPPAASGDSTDSPPLLYTLVAIAKAARMAREQQAAAATAAASSSAGGAWRASLDDSLASEGGGADVLPGQERGSTGSGSLRGSVVGVGVGGSAPAVGRLAVTHAPAASGGWAGMTVPRHGSEPAVTAASGAMAASGWPPMQAGGLTFLGEARR